MSSDLIMNASLEDSFQQFASKMRVKATNFAKLYPEVLKFWQDGFTRYIRKMKEPKNIKDYPRRYFHLHAINYLLSNCRPEIIWNLCPGNLRTIFPIIEEYVNVSSEKGFKCYWINIDLVPEIKILNENFIKEKWPLAKIIKKDTLQMIQIGNFNIINLIGTLEDFFSVYIDCKVPKGKKEILICLDGISNAVIDPDNWISWWDDLKQSLASNFIGWYFTWLNSNTLDTKFDFYFDVALKKHNHPLYWLETTKIELSKGDSNNISSLMNRLKIQPLTKSIIKDISIDNTEINSNYIFRFYTKEDKSKIVYQTFYLNEYGLKILALQYNEDFDQFVGHREVDQILFSFSTELYQGKQNNFVKSIPYLGIKNH